LRLYRARFILSGMPINRPSQILIRRSNADADAGDALALRRLARLDSAISPPPEPLLVAELDGELKVALSLQDGSVIADPFTYTADVVSLLKLSARAEAGDGARHQHRRRNGRGLRLRGLVPSRRPRPVLRSSAP
jgi:hypothetical protein